MKFQSEGFTIEKKSSNISLFVVIALVPNIFGQLLDNLLKIILEYLSNVLLIILHLVDKQKNI